MNERQRLSQGQQEKKQNSQDKVFTLIDLEAEEHRKKQAHQAQVEGKAKGVEVSLSNPCFEVWTLLHLVDTGKGFKNCREVTKEVKRVWNTKYDQNVDLKLEIDCKRLLGLRTDAVKRAKKHHNHHSRGLKSIKLLNISTLSF